MSSKPLKVENGPKEADSTPKTISSFMEAEQLMWAKKMGEGISKWLNELLKSTGLTIQVCENEN